jgi:hypothetical protein
MSSKVAYLRPWRQPCSECGLTDRIVCDCWQCGRYVCGECGLSGDSLCSECAQRPAPAPFWPAYVTALVSLAGFVAAVGTVGVICIRWGGF